MSNALAVVPATNRAVARAATSTVPEMSFDAMLEMGDQLVSTGFLPKHLRNGAQVAAVIMTGREMGMQPMRAVRSLVLVEGKVVESADSQLARFKEDGGRAAFTQLDETGCVLALRHPNGDEHVEAFTIADAQRAGLAGKDVWKKYPKAMLRSRCITAGLKSIGWEGSVGNYDPEEAASFSAGGEWTPPNIAPKAVESSSDKWNQPRPPAAEQEEQQQQEEEPPVTMPLALAMTVPGEANNPKVWGGKGGVALGLLKPAFLKSVMSWIEKEPERQEKFARLHAAAQMVFNMKDAEVKALEAAQAVGAADPLTPEQRAQADAIKAEAATAKPISAPVENFPAALKDDDNDGLPF